jgi:predicted RNase H-like nuclease
MLFLGIDFGWYNRPSGLACLRWDGARLSLEGIERRAKLEEILAWVEQTAGAGPALVAVDAPTIILNETGMRAPDRLTHVLFGRFGAACYPANLGRPYAVRTVRLGCELEARGFRHAPALSPRTLGRFQIEVFPHPAIVHLFGLERIIRYKKGLLAARRAELARYRQLILEGLPRLTPALEPPVLPPVPQSGAALKEVEDLLDALLCAYVGAHWWYWGLERNLVLGSVAEGYIIVPARSPVGSSQVGALKACTDCG